MPHPTHQKRMSSPRGTVQQSRKPNGIRERQGASRRRLPLRPAASALPLTFVRESPERTSPSSRSGNTSGICAKPELLRARLQRMRVLKCVLLWLSPFLALAIVTSPALAQKYLFRVPEMKLQAYIQPDASVKLVYDITFDNLPDASAIDVVDIGLPHSGYRIGNMSASIDGNRLNDIRKSSYINIGVEVRLGQHKIRRGRTGTLHFECTMPDMIYADTTDGEYASFQMRPTWFDALSQVGTTNFQYAVHCLPGVPAEEIRYQDQRQTYANLAMFGEGDEKHAVAIWEAPQLTLSSRNPKLSVSFPKTGMSRVVEQSTIDLLIKWMDERPNVKLWSLVALLVTFAVMFLRFSNGTGFVLLLILGAPLALVSMANTGWHLVAWPAVVGLFATNEFFLGRRKSTYLPAMATVEGGGIKRGLTAPQAAVLLELPLGKVVGMVLFGLLKKGVLSQVSDDPFAVRVNQLYTIPENRRRTAAKLGIVIHDYEHAFIDALKVHSGPTETCDLSKPMGKLVKSTTKRMKGFDLDVTREYYQSIVARAWTEAKSVGEFKGRTEVIERNFEWMMMDPDWTVVFEDWGRRGYEYHPEWRRIPRHTGGGSSQSGGSGAGGGTPTPGSETSLGDVAASFAGWAETQSGKLADAIDPGGMGIEIPGGILDLSGVDRVTADVFEALAESSGSGGGGGGGCACACAGCACACACAGGGR